MASSPHNNICTCFGVSKQQIIDAICAYNIKGVDQITKATRAGAGCGSCRVQIREIIDQVRREEQLDMIEAKKYEQAKVSSPVIPVIKQLRLINAVIDKISKAYQINIKFDNLKQHEVHITFLENDYGKQAEVIEALQNEIAGKVIKGLVVVAK